MKPLDELFHFGFVKTRQFLLALDDHRALEQVRILEHELDRFVLRRRLLLHVFLAVKRRPRVEKLLYRIVADDLSQFLFGKWIFAVLPLFEIDFFCLQETSCLAAGRSCRLIEKLDSGRHSYLKNFATRSRAAGSTSLRFGHPPFSGMVASMMATESPSQPRKLWTSRITSMSLSQ